MKFISTALALTTAIFISSAPVLADACDYRPSRLLGETGSKAAIGIGGTVAGGGAIGTSVGLYTLVNAGSGLTMLGSTMAGASGAGTVGIIAGTGGAIGAAGAVILNPFVWVPAALVGIGGGGFEATCAFLVDERITEFDEVLTIMRSFNIHADKNYFLLNDKTIPPYIELRNEGLTFDRFYIEDLYIVDGVLKSRDWGPNTTIGRVVFLNGDTVK